MLTDTKWIDTGMPFPPMAERERIKRYGNNEKLFLGLYKEVFGENFSRLEHHLKKHRQQPDTMFNYPQLLTKKTADFVCGEPAIIKACTKSGDVSGEVNGILAEADFDTLLYEAIMDVSRFGDAPIKIMKGRASLAAPECWFPIVDPTDIKKVDKHVLAFLTKPDEDGKFREIYLEIHDVGQVETRRYEVVREGGGIAFGGLIASEVVETNLEDFGVMVLKNVSHSKSVFGMDDYGAVAGIVEKIMWRLNCIDAVLDKHSEPSLSGPLSALSYDEDTGMHYLDLQNYFARTSKDDADVAYLTWDGNLDSSFREIDILLNQLYIISEMGASFMDADNAGQVMSGTALKLRMISPRIKAQRIAGVNTATVKRLIKMLAGMHGIELGLKDIAITWNDGLPNDPAEELEYLMNANGGLPVMSQLDAVKSFNRADDAAAEKILGQIRTNNKA